MKLKVLQENLVKAINISSRFTSGHAQLPVLANILLSAERNKLLISATNLEVSINLSVGAKVEKGGNITVPAKVINDIVSNLDIGQVDLETENEILKISTNDFTSSVSGMNSSDFPSVPQKLGSGILKIPREEFVDALSQVLFAVSNDETRPILTGVLLLFNKGKLALVSTDGFRLSQKTLPVKSVQKPNKVILPKTVLSELFRLSSEDKNISFSFKTKDNQIVFGLDNFILSSRILEGEFPDFEKIIPKESKVKVSLDKEDFLRAVKLASVFARDSANIVKVKVEKDRLDILAESQSSGSQKTKVAAKVEGGELEIAFNYRFLEEFLQSVQGNDIQIEFSDSNSPGVFTDPKDASYLHLVMPVKIQN